MLIHLIGPGGAGKSTTAPLLASKMEFDCIDLDKEYLKSSIIEKDIRNEGYEYYVRKNIDLYLELTSSVQNTILATSSGFMTYHHDIHPKISLIQKRILKNRFTVLLLPSFDLEECVRVTVSRQFSKSHESKSFSEQSDRIVKRFPIYSTMGNIQVCTNEPVEMVVSKIVSAIGF